MSAPKLTATAVATVTIELRGLGSWGEECQIKQVRSQAEEAACGRLRQLFSKSEGRADNMRVVGDITIKTIVVEDEK